MVATAMPISGHKRRWSEHTGGSRFKQALAWSNGLARPSQASFQASWRDTPILKAGCKDPRTLQDL